MNNNKRREGKEKHDKNTKRNVLHSFFQLDSKIRQRSITLITDEIERIIGYFLSNQNKMLYRCWFLETGLQTFLSEKAYI